jgi:hypothetical protein
MVGNAGNATQKGAQNIVDNTGVQIINVFGGSDSTVVGQQQGIVGASKGYQYGYSVTQNGWWLTKMDIGWRSMAACLYFDDRLESWEALCGVRLSGWHQSGHQR